MKISPVGTEAFHANGWTDRQTDRNDDETNSRFSSFWERAI